MDFWAITENPVVVVVAAVILALWMFKRSK